MHALFGRHLEHTGDLYDYRSDCIWTAIKQPVDGMQLAVDSLTVSCDTLKCINRYSWPMYNQLYYASDLISFLSKS